MDTEKKIDHINGCQEYTLISDEIFSLFFDEPFKQNAFFIWYDIMSQMNKNPDFVPRKNYIREKFNIGNHKFDQSIGYLKTVGLVETFPIYDNKGKFSGAQYKFYALENRVINPSLANTPGPQSKTVARSLVKSEQEGKKNAIQNSKGPLNGDSSESRIFRLSENPIIYLQDRESEREKRNTLIRFTGSPDDHKKCFLDHFPGQNTFQTFDDSTPKRRNLSKIYHKNKPLTLEAKNNQGAGIFLTINETDGKGRAKENIIRVRAVFADLDGAPLEPVLEYNPSLVIESSPGRFHAYWLTDDTPREHFSRLQQAIILQFASDPSVKDLSRVMRIPGYYHAKGDLFMSRILYTNNRLKYSFNELGLMFPPIPVKYKSEFNNTVFKVHGVLKGQRNSQLCKIIGAMINQNYSEKIIKEKAYLFGETCTPPLRKLKIDSVLKSATKWTPENQ